MIQIKRKADCCGCGACCNKCPQDCIDMELDSEGFLYPVIDQARCIDCGLCDEVCPLKNKHIRGNDRESLFYGAYNKSTEVMEGSSSGGIFWLLAEEIINQNGVVYGVCLNEGLNVSHARAVDLKQCETFLKSKYLESNTGNTYQNAENDLHSGKVVLYSGTPCQIAGLYHYLGKDYEKLFTSEIVCHGVPSKMVFDKFISYLNKKHASKAISMVWRDKRSGWKPNRVSIKFENGMEIISPSLENLYQRGFLMGMYHRPSCYSCHFASIPRGGDITLADFWGYQGPLTVGNKNRGLSIVVTSSDKGKQLFRKISKHCIYESVDRKYVEEKCRHMSRRPAYNANRPKFFADIEKHGFLHAARKYIAPFFVKKMINKFKQYIFYKK